MAEGEEPSAWNRNPVGSAHRVFFRVETAHMFKHNWRKFWPWRRRLPEAAVAAASTRTEASVLEAVAQPSRERTAVLLSTLALAGNEYVAEEDVDRSTLGELFARAFMRVTYDKDGDLWAQDYDAPKVMITVDLVRRMIRFAAAWRYREAADSDARRRLAARTNDAFMAARFRAVEPDLFLAEYYLSYEKGLLAAQLVHSLKLFGRVAQSAVREHDGEDVLQ
jgi:hypothetical protein